MKQLLLIMAGIVLLSGNGYSQDTIIDSERNEIRSKVTEITDNEIKYKKWENLQGPLYNISKAKVIMIIYENGQREMFKEAVNNPVNENKNLVGDVDRLNKEEIKLVSEPTIGLSSTESSNLQKNNIDFSRTKEKVEYQPTRLNIGLAPFHIGSDSEVNIIRNIFNIGVGYLYYFPPNVGIVSSQYVNVYGSLYLPVNLMLKNYEKQNKGFFPFVHLGYGLHGVVYENDYGRTRDVIYSHGFNWKIGLDYLITESWGVTLTSYEARNTVFGLVFSF